MYSRPSDPLGGNTLNCCKVVLTLRFVSFKEGKGKRNWSLCAPKTRQECLKCPIRPPEGRNETCFSRHPVKSEYVSRNHLHMCIYIFYTLFWCTWTSVWDVVEQTNDQTMPIDFDRKFPTTEKTVKPYFKSEWLGYLNRLNEATSPERIEDAFRMTDGRLLGSGTSMDSFIGRARILSELRKPYSELWSSLA